MMCLVTITRSFLRPAYQVALYCKAPVNHRLPVRSSPISQKKPKQFLNRQGKLTVSRALSGHQTQKSTRCYAARDVRYSRAPYVVSLLPNQIAKRANRRERSAVHGKGQSARGGGPAMGVARGFARSRLELLSPNEYRGYGWSSILSEAHWARAGQVC